ncbi:MAG: hypothetical protein P4L39_08875 [Humidesulfovibrio sp.]|nr:hypothetical protein [Humidesulfovibrio sp.]
MVPLLSECWRFVEYLLRPEDETEGARWPNAPVWALAGAAKALFWAGVALLAGLGLARLG